jgi:two-component system, NtrC family, sensor kinase
MSLLKKLKPKFWDYHDVAANHQLAHFSFRRKWKLLVLVTTLVAFAPLAALTIIGYDATTDALETEIRQNTYSLVSNTLRTVSFFISERRSMLDLILKEQIPAQLADPARLAGLLKSLKQGIGGFVDLGVVDPDGNLFNYAGPYNLAGTNICEDKCFRQVLERGFFISDLIPGRRPEQHLIMALRGDTTSESFNILRATLDIKTFNTLLDQLDLGENGDAFIINEEGILLTPSRFHGDLFAKLPLSFPMQSPEITVTESHAAGKGTLIIGHAAIADTSMRLVMVRFKDELMSAWQSTRNKLLIFLAANVVVIILVILWMATYLVNRIHAADAKRVTALHQVEYANKIASLSRLSAGVAHEINNPLAIIGEKAGLLKDLLAHSTDAPPKERLAGLADDAIAAVKRCGDITQRLLNFARHMETRYEIVDLDEIITEMVSFLQKEAEYRHIHIHIDFPDHFPKFESDRGNLQQIFLNLLNNAFAAMDDEGQLDISGKRLDEDKVEIVIADDGHGIPEEDLPHIFEPFFSSKISPEGTGLGLSVTYGFIREIGGRIRVESQVGEGTRFIIELPLKPEQKERKNVYSYY